MFSATFAVNSAALTPIAIPGGKALGRLVHAELVDTGDYTNAANVAPVQLAIVNAAPAANNQIQLSSPSDVTVYQALNDGYQSLRILAYELGEEPKGAPALGGARV